MSQQLRRGRPIFLDLAIATGAVGIAGPRQMLYVGAGFLLAWLGSRYLTPLPR